MDRGRLLAMDSVRSLIDAHGGESTVIAMSGDGEVRLKTKDPLGELESLQARGGLKSFSVESPNLEGVFLNLTGRHLRDD
jgi:hypothetical protein